jgi:hypothetical protein
MVCSRIFIGVYAIYLGPSCGVGLAALLDSGGWTFLNNLKKT